MALFSFLWDRGRAHSSQVGIAFALNGLPFVKGTLVGLFQCRINKDELVSIAITAELLR